ncbi:MAG: transglycosylase SLT domain-containing protein [Bacteroidetes bacterium]|nr:transglycosylase SLT domain-containing protein [Bacteroidota bacterium]
MNRVINLFILLCALNNGHVFSKSKDSVYVIKITDTSRIRKIKEQKGEVYINPASVSDTSRLIKRKPKQTETSNKSTFNVSRALFGPFADFINDYIRNYHNNHGERISRISSRSKGQFKLIENIMKSYNLPREMKSLAIIESALNCNAVSPVGAVGPWQFMAGTAKMLGLRVDGGVDERMDFYKSTKEAAKYLKQLYGMFNDYLLVIASYNCGPAPVIRAINSGAGSSFWDIKSRLPKETQNHVMAFIATSIILDKFSNVLNFGNIPKGIKPPKADFSKLNSFAGNNESSVEENEDVQKPKFTQEELENMAVLKVRGNYKLNAISNILDEDIVRLKRWNPGFDENIMTATAPIHLRIPINKLEKFIISKDEIIAASIKLRS